jgi:hypothetical protein
MRLPVTAIVAPEKMTRYLLVRQARGDKSAFLARAGYTPETADHLINDERTQLLPLDATQLHSTTFGDFLRNPRRANWPERYRVACPLHLDERAFVRRDEIHYFNPGDVN